MRLKYDYLAFISDVMKVYLFKSNFLVLLDYSLYNVIYNGGGGGGFIVILHLLKRK